MKTSVSILPVPLSTGLEELIKLKEEVLRLKKEERRRMGEAEALELLSMEELVCLEREVESSLNRIRERQDQLRAEQKKESLRKEAELLRENEKLRREVEELQRARREGCGLPMESRATSACSSVSTSRNEVVMPMISDDHSDTFLQLRSFRAYGSLSRDQIELPWKHIMVMLS
ncbi:hypothetical protein L7F22_032650 [Adiantum nelumboides]|nr:hypothetical protein [Adiantum nelumboides]